MALEKFSDSKVNFNKLLEFGFSKQASNYQYQIPIVNDQFLLTVTVDDNGTLNTHVIDSESGDEYVLHLQNASGKFVQQVSSEYQDVLNKIRVSCYENDVFKESQAIFLIDHVKKTYGNDLEFLWKKFPHNAIWRRSDTNKWYGALLSVSKQKLNLDSNEIVTVLDIRAEPEKIQLLIDGKNYFPGYHMNKKNWFTIILDGSIDNHKIVDLLQQSYDLATK